MLELLAASNLAVCRQANNWIQAGHFPASDSQATAVLYSKHLQTKNSFNHLVACLNMLRTVLNMVGTLLCSKMKKDQKAIPATWLEHCWNPALALVASSHCMGLVQVHWSHSLTCRKLKTQTLLLHVIYILHVSPTYSHFI